MPRAAHLDKKEETGESTNSLSNILLNSSNLGDAAESLISFRAYCREQVLDKSSALSNGNCLLRFHALLQQHLESAQESAQEEDIFDKILASVREPDESLTEAINQALDGHFIDPTATDLVELVDGFFSQLLDDVIGLLAEVMEDVSRRLADEVLVGLVEELLVELLADVLIAELAVASERNIFCGIVPD